MFRYIAFFILAFFVYRILKSLSSRPSSRVPDMSRTLAGEDMVKDPNCNIYIPRISAIQDTIKGENHYFCTTECRDAYKSKA